MMPTGASSIPARRLNAGVDPEVQVGLFQLQLARFLEAFDQAVLELELADEAQAVAEAVVEQQDEAVEIEQRVLVLGPVEVKVHVAGDRPGLGHRRRVLAGCAGAGAALPRLARPPRRPAPRRRFAVLGLQFEDPRAQLPKLPLELLDPRFGRRFLRWDGGAVGSGGCAEMWPATSSAPKNAISVRNDEPPASTVLFKTLFLIERNRQNTRFVDDIEDYVRTTPPDSTLEDSKSTLTRRAIDTDLAPTPAPEAGCADRRRRDNVSGEVPSHAKRFPADRRDAGARRHCRARPGDRLAAGQDRDGLQAGGLRLLLDLGGASAQGGLQGVVDGSARPGPREERPTACREPCRPATRPSSTATSSKATCRSTRFRSC